MKKPLKNIDLFYIITLKGKEERAEAVKKDLINFGLDKKKIVILVNLKDSENPERGCFNSHLRAILDAKKRKAKNVAIFEDDLDISDNIKKDSLDNINNFLEENKEWDIFYLGHLPNKIKTTKYKGVVRVNSYLTHAYILNERTIKNLSNIKYEGKAIDRIYNHLENSYAIYPMIMYQKPIVSTIINQRNYLTEKKSLQIFEEKLYEGKPRFYVYIRYFSGKENILQSLKYLKSIILGLIKWKTHKK